MPTYYVDGVDGNDANAGTSEGSGNAWATIDHAMNNVIAGDRVYVKGNGTYSEQATIDTVGGFTTTIIFEGYTTTPGDNGKATISGTTYCITTSISAAVYYLFKNFIMTGASSHGFYSFNGDAIQFHNCEFNNNGGVGAWGDNDIKFYSCEAASNTSHGFDCDASAIYVGCIAHSNGGKQFYAASSTIVYKCLAYGSTGANDNCIDVGSGNFIGNTMDGENVASVNGLNIISDIDAIIIDNLIYDCDTAVNASASSNWNAYASNNLLNSNTTDYTYSGELVGINDVSGAPAFTNEAGDDYRPSSSSPAVDAQLKPGGIT